METNDINGFWRVLALVLLSALFTGATAWMAFASDAVSRTEYAEVIQRMDTNIIELKLRLVVIENELVYLRQDITDAQGRPVQ